MFGRLFGAGLLGIATLFSGACDSRPVADLGVVVDTIGDTVRIRSSAGAWSNGATPVPSLTIGVLEGDENYMLGRLVSLAEGPDGSIYSVDAQGPVLRVYDSSGIYLRTLGGEGEGPGEYKQPDSGLAVLPDGRVLVRDPGNGRVMVYGSDGSEVATWPTTPGFQTSGSIVLGDDGHIYSPTVLDLGVPMDDWEQGLLHYTSEGEVLDPVRIPVVDFEPGIIEVRNENGWARNSVPFFPGAYSAFMPSRAVAQGISNEYRIDVTRPDGSVLRVEREVSPVPVGSGERSSREAAAIHNMKGMDPSFSWNGPDIPDVKPFFQGLYAGGDGTLWVHLHRPGYETEDPAYTPRPGEPDAPSAWLEPLVFDVFEPDGHYLGEVAFPAGTRTYPRPLLSKERVIAVVTDDLGVQRIVRFDIEPSAPGQPN